MSEPTVVRLVFANGQVDIAEDEDDINYMVRKFVGEYDVWGLEKTKKKQHLVQGKSVQNKGSHQNNFGL